MLDIIMYKALLDKAITIKISIFKLTKQEFDNLFLNHEKRPDQM